jgi:hypothetical protein
MSSGEAGECTPRAIRQTHDENALIRELLPHQYAIVRDGLQTLQRIEHHVARLLVELGKDPARDGLARAPARVWKALRAHRRL